ncbi:MAG: histidine kinase [Lachnospiraceae bacterium]|nr:histidine kinase [Lachnospiraceae bacterium]
MARNDNYKKYLHTIRFRILLITITFLVLISTAITFISFYVVSDSIQKNLIQTSETKLAFLCTSIDSNISGVKSVIASCQNSVQVRKFVMAEHDADNKAKREARETVSEIYTANAALPSQIIRLVIMGSPGSDILQIVESPFSTLAVSSEGIYALPYFDALHSHLEKIATDVLTDPFVPKKEAQMLPYLHAIQHPYKAGAIGYIFTEISISVVTKPVESLSSETYSKVSFQIGGTWYQYADGRLAPDASQYQMIEDLSAMSLNSTTIQKVINQQDGGAYIMLTRPLLEQGLYVTEFLDEHYVKRDTYHAFSIIILIVILSAGSIGILLSWFLNRTINVPVGKLQERMARISQGDFSKDSSTEWEHELGDIGKKINELSENVLTLMNQKIEDERQKKDYEYKMLQSQINPHFLYNTLNSIKWMATIQNAPGIAEMTTSLSRLLKDISKGTTTLIPLEHELSLIKDYFTIQQYRYGGTITLNIEMEKGLSQCKIVKFTLQPIVENSIFHGIEPKGNPGTISIHIYQEGEKNVRIDVTDDGIGIPPDIADSLLDTNALAGSSFFKEIGISNVHKRLQYEFGDGYGLSIHSKMGQYTTVSILLPYQGATEREENYD